MTRKLFPEELSSCEHKLAEITHAQLMEKPSREQLLGTMCYRPCISPQSQFKNICAIITGIWTVTPLTNITPWSLNYQLYLNTIFHRGNVAFYTHAITMPLVNLFVYAWAANVKFSSTTEEWVNWLDLSFVFALAIWAWYVVWGICCRHWWMGPCALPIVAVCYVGGHFYWEYVNTKFHPMICAAIAAFIQSGSHLPEDLPPRVSGANAWTKKRDFLWRQTNSFCPFFVRVIRLLITAIIFGPLDEFIASPRLLPLFWSVCPMYKVMKWCNCSCFGSKESLDEQYRKFDNAMLPGYRVQCVPDNDTVRVEPLSDKLNPCCSCLYHLSLRLTRGTNTEETLPNPALDYIGPGGSTIIRVHKHISCCDVLCHRYTENDMELDTKAGLLQTWRVYHPSYAVGISGDDPAAA